MLETMPGLAAMSSLSNHDLNQILYQHGNYHFIDY